MQFAPLLITRKSQARKLGRVIGKLLREVAWSGSARFPGVRCSVAGRCRRQEMAQILPERFRLTGRCSNLRILRCRWGVRGCCLMGNAMQGGPQCSVAPSSCETPQHHASAGATSLLCPCLSIYMEICRRSSLHPDETASYDMRAPSSDHLRPNARKSSAIARLCVEACLNSSNRTVKLCSKAWRMDALKKESQTWKAEPCLDCALF